MAKPIRVDGRDNYCHGCEAIVVPADAPVVQVGDTVGYDNQTTWLCFACVKAAMDELTRPASPDGSTER